MKFFRFLAKPEAAKPVPKSATKQAKSGLAGPFHAVEIKGGAGCCQAAKSMEGKRFLSRGAVPPPKVPMVDCDRQANCHCRYIHYDDRRTEVRRNVWDASFATGNGGEHFAKIRGTDRVRKAKRGRRKDD